MSWAIPELAIAQPTGLRLLAIPGGLPIVCDTTPRSPGIRGLVNPAQRNVDIGDMVELGANRNVETTYDSTGRPIVMYEIASSVQDGLVLTRTVAVLFVDASTTGGVYIEAARPVPTGAGRRPSPRDSVSLAQRNLTAAEIRDARRLATWILARGCRP